MTFLLLGACGKSDNGPSSHASGRSANSPSPTAAPEAKPAASPLEKPPEPLMNPSFTIPDAANCQGLATTATQSISTSGRRLSDAGYLRKLSLHLRGVSPSADEYSRLKNAGDKESFFKAMIDEYMKSPGYRDKMVFRLTERFRLRPPALRGNTPQNPFGGDEPDATTDLFGRVADENLPWDQLLTGTHYNAYPKSALSGQIGDFGFLRAIVPGLPDEGNGAVDLGDKSDPTKIGDGLKSPTFQIPETPTPVPVGIAVDFPPDDPRIAGALTSTRFINRYATTALNKNRRRAAAVYNFAFCDSMLPSVITGNDPKHDFLEKSFADKFEVKEADIGAGLKQSAEALHGADADCRACHMKLDPLGKTFQFIGTVLPSRPSPGALVLRRSANTVFMQKVAGIGELARLIVQQPEYVDCQTRYLWTEFIGRDVPVTKARAQAMQCDFIKVGRKTNDFVKQLVTAEDFRSEPSDRGQLLFNDVKDLLKRCDSCHAKVDDIPPFAQLPIKDMQGADRTSTWITRIARRMDLPDDDSRKMPKDSKTNWSEDDLNTLKRWLATGAKDEEGKPLK